MGLSPELLRYAENIWRRFPEVFISLGSPDVEDVFELRRPGSSHSIVDTLSEKVIEVVLPRRDRKAAGFEVPRPELWAPEDDADDVASGKGPGALSDFDDDELDTSIEAGLFSPTSSSSPFSPVTLVGDEMELQVEHLSREISHLASTLEECVSREVCAQLAQGFSGPLAEAPAAQARQPQAQPSWQQPPAAVSSPWQAQQPAPPLIHGRPVAGSALAARRRFRLFAVEAKGLRRPGCVVRVADPPPDQVVDSSPGAHIQAAARRCPQRQDSGISSPGEPFLPPQMMGLPTPFAGFSPPQTRTPSPERDFEDCRSEVSPGARIQRAAQALHHGLQPALGPPGPPPVPTHLAPPPLVAPRDWADLGFMRLNEAAHISFLTASGESPHGSHVHDGSPLSLTESSASVPMSYEAPPGGWAEEGSPRKRR